MSNLTEALELIAWFDECDGFRQGTDAPHKWVLQADSELRRLSEQVEKLTKERDELHRAFNQPVPQSELEKMQEQLAAKDAANKWLRSAVTLQAEQLAALAEQNEKMRSFLEFAWKDIPMSEYAFEILEHVMNLPNLATPLLNKYQAEGIRMAAEICETAFAHGILQLGHRAAIAKAIRAKADELEQSNG